jgi:hypothetical protein
LVVAPLLALAALGKPRSPMRRRPAGPFPGAAHQFIAHSTLRCEAALHGLQMIQGSILNFVPLLLGLFAAQPGIVAQSVTRLVGGDQIILRIPVQPRQQPQIEWRELKGPKCIPVASIRRALMAGTEQVDFILSTRARVRAHLDEDCPALDFYRGFYLQVQDDHLCAHRDAIHSRMGGSCTIDKFKQLVPKLPR